MPPTQNKAHKLRHIDTTKALEHMIDAIAMPGGISYEDYLRSCLAPLPTSNDTKKDSSLPSLEVQEVTKIHETVKVSTDIIEAVSAMGAVASDGNEDEFFQDAVNDETNASSIEKVILVRLMHFSLW